MVSFPAFNYFQLSSLRKATTFFAPPPPLCHYIDLALKVGHKPKRNENFSYGFCPHFATISLCHTPKVTSPSVIRNNSCGVTQRHTKQLSPCPVKNGPQTAGAYLPGGKLASHQLRPHVYWLIDHGKKSLFRKWGINCPNKRFSSCNLLKTCISYRILDPPVSCLKQFTRPTMPERYEVLDTNTISCLFAFSSFSAITCLRSVTQA